MKYKHQQLVFAIPLIKKYIARELHILELVNCYERIYGTLITML